MCFNAAVSFAAGTVLAISGVITLTKTKERKHVPFACIPLIFSLQQFSEGLVWISFSAGGDFLRFYSIFIFLFVAQVLWPVWTPFSIFLVETQTKQKKIISALLVCGILVSVYNAGNLFSSGVAAETKNHHVYYLFGSQKVPLWTTGLFYCLATIVSPSVSTLKRMKLLGVGIFASFIFSELFFKETVISVWCFFAALISAIVYFVITGIDGNKLQLPK